MNVTQSPTIGFLTSSLTIETPYTLVCDGLLLDTKTIKVFKDPELKANKRIVTETDTITLTWDTHNGAEDTCRLNGGLFKDFQLPKVGTTERELSTGSVQTTVGGNTTFILSCPSPGDAPAKVSVELIPKFQEQ